MKNGVGILVSGRFKMVVRKPSGEVRGATTEFDNLILDAGLRYLLDGKDKMLRFCIVGASSLVEQPTDTSMPQKINAAIANSSARASGDAESPGRVVQSFYALFRAGQATGVIAEVGMSPVATPTPSSPLFSRTLIRDSAGRPTTLTVAPDEELEVYYELSAQTDPEGQTFTLPLSSGVHTGIVRPQGVRARDTGTTLANGSVCLPAFSVFSGPSARISTSDDGPYGTRTRLGAGSTATRAPSENLTHRDVTYVLDKTEGNHPEGFAAMSVGQLCFTQLQISFDPPIPKTADQTFSFVLRYSIGRA